MAKQKKTVEELLVEALVPKEEQPFEVPENWVWTKLGFIGEVGSSKRVLKSDWKSEGIPFYRAREIVKLNKKEKIENGIFISEELYSELKKKHGVPKEHDLLITAVGTIGKPYIVKSKDIFYFKDASVIWYKNNFNFNINFINLFYKTDYTQNQIKSMSAGTTVDTYTISNAKQTIIPLPPLNEQTRIVDKVERLLSKIDEAKQLIDEAKESFELRRAAILDKAIRGHFSHTPNNNVEVAVEQTKNIVSDDEGSLLTSSLLDKYFKELPNGWKVVKIGSVCLNSFYGPRFGKSDYTKQGIPTIRTTDMTDEGDIVLKDTPRVNLTSEELERYRVKKGDLLITRTGSIGQMAVFNKEYDAIPSAYLIRFRFSEHVYSEYMYYYLTSPLGKNMLGLGTTSTTQPNINAQTIREIPLILPPYEEQKRLVKKIKRLFEISSKGVKTLVTLQEKLKQNENAILSKAFRGELGTNDPSEENVIELLKEVLQEQVK